MYRGIIIAILVLSALVAGLRVFAPRNNESAPSIASAITPSPPMRAVAVASNETAGLASSPPLITGKERKRLATLERDYEDTADFGIRLNLMNQIGDFKEAAAVETLTRLFVIEMDESLKIELLDVINTFEEHNAERLAMLAFAVEPMQPVEVREAAIDVLITIEDGQAVTLLESLLKDADEDVREAASSGLTLLRELLATQ